MPHSLDVMHITKNVCESLLGTLLKMLERTKDGPKASVVPLHEDSSAEEKLIFALSQGAEHNLMTYEAYDINDYTFYTEEKDMKCDDYQNSGVTMESYTGNDKDRYYGRIEEIWELSYLERRSRCSVSDGPIAS